MWYQDSLAASRCPSASRPRTPACSPGFRATAERFKKVTWEGLVARDPGLRLARHGGAPHPDHAGHGHGTGALLDELRRPAPGQDPPLHGAVRPGGHAALPTDPPAPAILTGHGYNAWFQCINGCPGQFSLLEVIYRCPTCGDLLEVQHDMEALRSRSAAAWMQLFDDRYRRNIYPYGSGRLGQEGVGGALHRQREHRVDVRGQLQPLLGRPLRQAAPRRGPLGQAVRQLAHGVVQGPRHDRAGLRGQADDGGRRAHRRRRLRLHRRHLGRARRLLRGGGHPGGGAPAEGQGLDRPARAAARQRRARALARHRLRRLHGGRAGDHQGEADLPGQLDEQPAHRGPEDGRHRDRAAVRLGGARLDRHPGRQPRQRARARAGLRDDAGARADQPAAAHLPGPGRARQPALPLVPGRLQDASSRSSPSRRWPRRSRSATR